MSPAKPRFDVELEGRSARLRLASPLSVPGVRVLRLCAALEPFGGRVDLRGGALGLRHRRSTAVEAELEIDIGAVLEAARAVGVRIAARASDARGVELVVDDGGRGLRGRVEPEAEGIDLRLRSVGAHDASRWLAALSSADGLESDASAIRVRDPVGWAIRAALMPHGFRAPRVTGGALAWSLAGTRLGLSLRTEES